MTSPDKKCPKCGLWNSESALICDCGYDFQTQKQVEIPLEKDQPQVLIATKIKLENQVKNGANSFFWIAGLSLLNSVSILFGQTWTFFIGLGITQVIDAFSIFISSKLGTDKAVIAKLIAIILDAGIASIFVLFGILARRRQRWSFYAGMILYFVDGLLFIWLKNYFSVGFHVLVLFWLGVGLKSESLLAALERGKNLQSLQQQLNPDRRPKRIIQILFWIFIGALLLSLVVFIISLVSYL